MGILLQTSFTREEDLVTVDPDCAYFSLPFRLVVASEGGKKSAVLEDDELTGRQDCHGISARTDLNLS